MQANVSLFSLQLTYYELFSTRKGLRKGVFVLANVSSRILQFPHQTAVTTRSLTVVYPDQAFGGQSNKGAPKSLNLFKYYSFVVTIFGFHITIATFHRPRKWLI